MTMRDDLRAATEVLAQTVDCFVDGNALGTDDPFEVLTDPKGSSLVAVGRLEALVSVLRDAQREAARQAIATGATWSEVGATLGISKQAAQQRLR